MPTLPEPSPIDATRLIEQLADAALGLDVVVDDSRRASDAAVNSHARTVSALADVIVAQLSSDPGYTPSVGALRALGWVFAEGPLWTAAQRAGLLAVRQSEPGEGLRLTETETGRGIMQRIALVMPDYSPELGV